MREIKFRAWDKVKRDMWDDVTFDHAHIYSGWDEQNERPLYTMPRDIVGIIMQYTGLKDKNGVEIYQGDYLKVKPDKIGYGSTSYGGIIEVTSDTCGFGLMPVKPTVKELDQDWREGGDGFDSASLWHIEEPKNVEVIGNIYENPELLETENNG